MIPTNTFCNSVTRKLPRTKIISDNDLPRIHEASIDLLENTGVIFEHEEVLKIFKKHGARVEGKTVFIPETIAQAAMERTPPVYRH